MDPFRDFGFFAAMNATFGFLDGSLNALPKEGLLHICGQNLQAQRFELVNATQAVIDNDLPAFVLRFTSGL
jgi:hypothetical protein